MKKLNQLSLFHTFLISLLVLGLYWIFIIQNDTYLDTVTQNISLTKVNIEEKQKEYEDIKTLIERFSDFKNEYETTKKTADVFFEYMNYIDNSTTFFDKLVNEPSIQAIGIKVNGHESQDETFATDLLGELVDAYKLVPLTIKIEGSYTQLLLFMSHLTEVQQLISIDKIRIHNPNQTAEQKANLTLDGNITLYAQVMENEKQEMMKKAEANNNNKAPTTSSPQEEQ